MELENLIRKKADLLSRRERLLGKLEAARENLLNLDSKLRERGIDPDSLEDEIERLRSEGEAVKSKLTAALNQAEKIITTIEDRVKG
jgi:chromosome segregation ATPase